MADDSSMRFTRVSVNFAVEYTIKGQTGEGIITDLSEGGIALIANQVLVEGDLVRITGLLGKNLRLDFWVRVKNYVGRKAGCEYEEMPYEMKRSMEDFVLRIIQARKQSRFEQFDR